MRLAFVKTLTSRARLNKNILLLTADLGYSVFEQYITLLPKQFLNAGIAEQNMTGVAAGMAMEGKIPFIYSIVPFISMRNFEQIRNDICYQNLNVKIVGVGAGFSYGPYGHTHHGLEDVGILRTIPNITILTPGDPVEAEWAVEKALSIVGPVYIRLGRAGEPTLHSKKIKTRVGKILKLRSEGKDFAILATGTMLQTSLEVFNILSAKNYNGVLYSVPTIKPFDSEGVGKVISDIRNVFTLEEHSVINGLGSAVAEVIAETGIHTRLVRFGVKDHFTKKIGNQEYMRKINNLSPSSVARKIETEITKNN